MAKLILILLLLPASGLNGTGVSFVVPNDALDQDGNDFSYFPFGVKRRYQQVYDASQFSAVPLGGGYIVEILFRADCSHCNGNCTESNMVANLSTTAKGPDQLSAVFDENLGTNNTRVFGPGQFLADDGCGFPCESSNPRAFEDPINLGAPFFYDPAKGNLLMELWLDGGDCGMFSNFASDAVTVAGDSVSRVYGLMDSTNAIGIDTTGLVTEFFVVVPSLTASVTTNAVVITWTAPQKLIFDFYCADTIGADSNWQVFNGQIDNFGYYHTVSLPTDSLGRARFFRLLCSNCEPIAPSNIPVRTNSP